MNEAMIKGYHAEKLSKLTLIFRKLEITDSYDAILVEVEDMNDQEEECSRSPEQLPYLQNSPEISKNLR